MAEILSSNRIGRRASRQVHYAAEDIIPEDAAMPATRSNGRKTLRSVSGGPRYRSLEPWSDMPVGSSSSTRPRRRRDRFSLHHRLGESSRTGMGVSRRQRYRPSLHRMLSVFFNSRNEQSTHDPSRTNPGSMPLSNMNSAVLTQSIPEHDAMVPMSAWTHSGLVRASTPSLDLVSPDTLLFSSPTFGSYASSLSGSDSLICYPAASRIGSVRKPAAGSEAYSTTTTEDTLDDFVLEPYQHSELTRSVSDVLLNRHFEVEDDGMILPAIPRSQSMPVPELLPQYCLFPHSRYVLPLEFFEMLMTYLDPQSLWNLRQTCGAWNAMLQILSIHRQSQAQALPTELLVQVFQYLHPVDFNSARHTCRTWMKASLNTQLLTRMLKRGGWWSGLNTERDVNTNRKEKFNESKVWSMSCFLARECALGSRWTGNGFVQGGSHWTCPNAMIQTGQVDFSDLATGAAGPDGRHSINLLLTSSVCGEYLLVAEGCMVYVYELNGHDIHPLTSVICIRKVLAMSMDNSHGRYTLGALLDGRIGMMCELQNIRRYDHEKSPKTYQEAEYSEQNMSVFESIEVHSGWNTTNFMRTRSGDAFNPNSTNAGPIIPTQQMQNGSSNFTGGGYTTTPLYNFHNNTESMPTEIGPRSIYRHLCSEDDPPRSVAVCPQRRCAVFGCSAGIEVHWEDALTGEHLHRWFPLTSESDIIHFVSPQHGMENPRRLRLISSTVHPINRSDIYKRYYSTKKTLGAHSGNERRGRPVNPKTLNHDPCEHYNAIPLNDGVHFLFTDPVTNLLYLGCDTPIGSPTKLYGKVMLIPPEERWIPRCYCAAADLTWGARIVAAFENKIVLYSIPPDVLALSRSECNDSGPSVPSYQTETPQEWLDWWPEADRVLPRLPSDTHPFWPLAVRGSVIGSMGGLVELAVNYRPDLAVWAFCQDGRSAVWQIDSGRLPALVTNQRVSRDGLIKEVFNVDAEGDVCMESDDGERSVSIDGSQWVMS